MATELPVTDEELHAQLDSFFAHAMEWKRRAILAEQNYNYWRNRCERAEERLGIVPDARDDYATRTD